VTRALSGEELATAVSPEAVIAVEAGAVFVLPENVAEVCQALRDRQGFDYLLSVTAIDYLDYFDVVYHLLSLSKNESAVLKARLSGRDGLSLPSVVPVWKTADFQEREIYDLLGISFDGHPNLKRIMMWEGFPGHPLRKDFLEFDHRTFAGSGSEGVERG